jgi:hypothetical protein
MGHNVAWAFAEYYLSGGRHSLIGLPLEEARLEGDVLRQRFESALLEYRFLLPAHLAVQLAPLGTGYFASLPAEAMAAASLVVPTATMPPPGPDLALRLTIHVEYPILPLDQIQTITLIVTDNDGVPVEGATALVVLRGPRSDVTPDFPATGPDGSTRAQVVHSDLLPGEIVNLEALASLGDRIGYAFGQYVVRAP